MVAAWNLLAEAGSAVPAARVTQRHRAKDSGAAVPGCQARCHRWQRRTHGCVEKPGHLPAPCHPRARVTGPPVPAGVG